MEFMDGQRTETMVAVTVAVIAVAAGAAYLLTRTKKPRGKRFPAHSIVWLLLNTPSV
jgi:hypothetical protein